MAWSFLVDHVMARGEFTIGDLIRDLDLDPAEDAALRGQIDRLAQAGCLRGARGGRWMAHGRMRAMVGRMVVPGGRFGFAVREEGEGPDVHVAARRMRGARHGDLVLVRQIPRARSDRGPDGEVMEILDRRSPRVAGVLREDATGTGRIFLPLDRALAPAFASGGPAPPDPGTVVWADGREGDRPAGGAVRITGVIGPEHRPEVQEAMVSAAWGLPGEFPEEALREAGRAPVSIPAEEKQRRADFSDQHCVTIDPSDARDHDDAVYAERIDGPRGGFRVFVHIADVSWYVRQGSACDREAARRGVSVYLPGRCLPMLPADLSGDRCSLLPDRDRLTWSVVMEFDDRATRQQVRFAEGWIRSRARLTYEEAEGRLATRRGGAVTEMLGVLEEFASRAAEARRLRGGIVLTLPETRVDVDTAGRPVAVRAETPGRAHALIEEAMLAANGAVAEHLARAGRPAVYRLHEDPDPAAVRSAEEALAPILRSLGRGTPAQRLRRMLDAARGLPEEEAVSLRCLRALPLARYSHVPGPHFGLGLPIYTHFTSPIRRYPDLLVHRLLRDSGALPAGRAERHARACSRLERRAEEAERMMVRIKTACLMADRVGQEAHGRVLGQAGEGLLVRLEGTGVEGWVPGRGPRRPGRTRRGAARAWRGPAPGEAVRVRVARTDIARGIVEFRLLSTG